METNMNFKRVDINEFTLEEAKETLKSKANFEVFGNATQAWKNAGSPAQNTREFKEFCANYLAQKTKNKQGLCCVIIYEPGKADTRERPYQIDNVVNDKGKRKYKTAYLIIDDKTNAILAQTTENKSKAMELAKDLYTKDGYRGTFSCVYAKVVVEGEGKAFTGKYQPSKSAKTGCFIFFGHELS